MSRGAGPARRRLGERAVVPFESWRPGWGGPGGACSHVSWKKSRGDLRTPRRAGAAGRRQGWRRPVDSGLAATSTPPRAESWGQRLGYSMSGPSWPPICPAAATPTSPLHAGRVLPHPDAPPPVRGVPAGAHVMGHPLDVLRARGAGMTELRLARAPSGRIAELRRGVALFSPSCFCCRGSRDPDLSLRGARVPGEPLRDGSASS